jgi:hypothetical protein
MRASRFRLSSLRTPNHPRRKVSKKKRCRQHHHHHHHHHFSKNNEFTRELESALSRFRVSMDGIGRHQVVDGVLLFGI